MNDTHYAYIHDADDEITEDLGEFTNLADAVDEVLSNMQHNPDWYYLGHTGRVVEIATQSTVWRVGPTQAMPSVSVLGSGRIIDPNDNDYTGARIGGFDPLPTTYQQAEMDRLDGMVPPPGWDPQAFDEALIDANDPIPGGIPADLLDID